MQQLDEHAGLVLYSLEDESVQSVLDTLEIRALKSPLEDLVTLATRSSSNRLLLEPNYTDFIWRDEYASFYAGLYDDCGSKCRRIHFFQSDCSKVVPLLDPQNTENAYFGFCVLRPTKTHVVGRSVIQVPEHMHEDIPCTDKFSVHILGREFSVEGFPFVQQDTQVMRCAQVSVLVSMLFLQHLKSQSMSLPHEISQIATRDFVQLGSPFPSAGLSPPEICHFLWKVGYGVLHDCNPTVHDYDYDPTSIVPYLQSKVPAILLSQDHAVTAVGYRLSDDIYTTGAVATVNDFLDEFIVHDDRVGPYQTVSRVVLANQEVTATQESSFSPFQYERMTSYIIPTPKKLYLRASSAIGWSRKLVQRGSTQAFIASKAGSSKAASEFVRALCDDSGKDCIVLCPSLISSENFKKECWERRSVLDPELVAHYMNSHLPRLVWVVEIMTRSSLFSPRREILGELIFDASGNPRAQPLVSGHFPGIITERDGGSSKQELDGGGPYPSWNY